MYYLLHTLSAQVDTNFNFLKVTVQFETVESGQNEIFIHMDGSEVNL